jgi:hypothetical protein
VPGSRCTRRRWLTLIPLVFLWALAFVSTQSAFAGSPSYWSAPGLVDPAVAPASVSCTSSSFCVAVGYAGGDAGSAVIYNGSTWSEASVVDTSDGLSSVSCVSSSFCMAMDGSGGALTYNGSTWSAPTPTGTDLTKVSCVSSSFCVAVGGSSQASVYSGGMWSALSSIGVSADSISCASEAFCVAVGSSNGGPGYAVTYDGGSWSAPTEIASGYDDPGPSSVSCGSPTFCVAVGGNPGNEETYSDGKWSSTPIGQASAVSCASESFCVAAAGEEVLTYDGRGWVASHPTGAQLTDGNASISCPTESFCAASSFSGTLVYDDGMWSTPVKLGSGGLSDVSCVSSALCTAVDRHGRALTYNGSTWSAPSQIDAEGDLASLSCPSASFCVAVGGASQGYALTYDGSKWSAPREVDTDDGLNHVTCVSESFCVALANSFVEGAERAYALTYNGRTWSAPIEIDTETVLRSVSCASSFFCVAVGAHDALVYNGSSWSSPAVVNAEGNLHAVSCASSSFCVAVAEHKIPAWSEAYAFTYDDGVWSAPAAIPRAPDRGGFDVGSISCPSSSFCAAGALFEGAGAIYEAGSWAPWTELGGNDDIASVSCPSASFCAAVDDAGQVFTYLSSTPHFPLAMFITGEGEITSTPAGITCSTAECTYEPEGEVTLMAKAAAGYEFAGWTGCDRVSGTDCTVTAASKVTALFSKAGKGPAGSEGPAGKEGVTGNEGKSGATGPAGVTGAMGTEGPPGAKGPAGKIELVTCETVKGKQHCTTKLVSGTTKFTAAGSFAQATLSRHGVVYAAGHARFAHGRMSLWLSPVRSLRPGEYTLTLISGTGRHKRTSIRSFILRSRTMTGRALVSGEA